MERVKQLVSATPSSQKYLVYLVLLAVFCLGVSLTVYYYLKLTNRAPPSDETLTKNLNIYAEVVHPAPLTCPSEFLVTDYIVAGSGYSVLPTKTVYSYLTADTITKVIQGGARIVELHVYNVDKKPVVGIADEVTTRMLSYNTVPFEKCCITIANSAFKTNSPFILSLVFHSDDTPFMNLCADTLKNTLRKFMLDSSYSYQRKNIALEPMCKLLNKLVIVSGGKHKGTGMDELVNVSWSSSTCRRMTYTQAAQVYDHDELIEYNKRNITLVVPDLDTITMANKNAEICFSYGCQWILMNYASMDNAMELYTARFSESSFNLKPDTLRYKPVTYKAPTPQNQNVSFQPKQMTSPLFDFTIGSVE